METEPVRDKPVFLPWIASIYTIIVGMYILDWNRALDFPLPETVDQGRWRGEYADFGGFCLIFGSALYPIAAYGAIYFLRQLTEAKVNWKKAVSIAIASAMLTIIEKFVQIGLNPDFLLQHVL